MHSVGAAEEVLEAQKVSYKEARRALSEKKKARGFYSVGSSTGSRAPDKSKSRCANCGMKGHWKNECTRPYKPPPSAGSSSSSMSKPRSAEAHFVACVVDAERSEHGHGQARGLKHSFLTAVQRSYPDGGRFSCVSKPRFDSVYSRICEADRGRAFLLHPPVRSAGAASCVLW